VNENTSTTNDEKEQQAKNAEWIRECKWPSQASQLQTSKGIFHWKSSHEKWIFANQPHRAGIHIF